MKNATGIWLHTRRWQRRLCRTSRWACAGNMHNASGGSPEFARPGHSSGSGTCSCCCGDLRSSRLCRRRAGRLFGAGQGRRQVLYDACQACHAVGGWCACSARDKSAWRAHQDWHGRALWQRDQGQTGAMLPKRRCQRVGWRISRPQWTILVAAAKQPFAAGFPERRLRAPFFVLSRALAPRAQISSGSTSTPAHLRRRIERSHATHSPRKACSGPRWRLHHQLGPLDAHEPRQCHRHRIVERDAGRIGTRRRGPGQEFERHLAGGCLGTQHGLEAMAAGLADSCVWQAGSRRSPWSPRATAPKGDGTLRVSIRPAPVCRRPARPATCVSCANRRLLSENRKKQRHRR